MIRIYDVLNLYSGFVSLDLYVNPIGLLKLSPRNRIPVFYVLV